MGCCSWDVLHDDHPTPTAALTLTALRRTSSPAYFASTCCLVAVRRMQDSRISGLAVATGNACELQRPADVRTLCAALRGECRANEMYELTCSM